MLEPLDTQDEHQAAPEERVPVGALHVPRRLAQWEREVTAASQAHAVPESLVYAVIDRESEGGEGPGYTPKGAAGTGDWTARTGHWLHKPNVKVVTELPACWHPPKDKSGKVIPGPYAIPDDGLGWGRGLGQHDHHRALAFNWRDPRVNIDKCAELLAHLIHVEFPKNQRAAIAAYNCGPKNVRRALLEQRDEDFYTTGRNYSTDVLRRRARFSQEPT